MHVYLCLSQYCDAVDKTAAAVHIAYIISVFERKDELHDLKCAFQTILAVNNLDFLRIPVIFVYILVTAKMVILDD